MLDELFAKAQVHCDDENPERQLLILIITWHFFKGEYLLKVRAILCATHIVMSGGAP